MITIIVPVYKTEQYITECIESIRNQSYEDFELLLIDDGSPDNAGYICDKYAQLDSRIRTIHKHNEGVSAARNTGIINSKGEYICFIDSDDYVDSDYLDILINGMKKGGMSACSLRIESERRKKNTSPEILSPSEAQISIFDYYGMLGVVCCKLYDAEVIKNNKILFNSNLTICEDLLFAIEYLRKINTTVSFSRDTPYFYRRNNDGADKSRFFSNKNFSEKSLSEIEALNECEKSLFQNIKVKKAYNSRKTKAAIDTIRVLTANNIITRDYYDLLKIIRKNTIKMIFSKYVANSTKLSALLCALSPKLELCIWKYVNI